MYHTPIGKGIFLPWLTFHLWAGKIRFLFKGLFCEEKLDFRVMFDVSSPRRRVPPGHGHVHLGELKDRKMGPFGPPR